MTNRVSNPLASRPSWAPAFMAIVQPWPSDGRRQSDKDTPTPGDSLPAPSHSRAA